MPSILSVFLCTKLVLIYSKIDSVCVPPVSVYVLIVIVCVCVLTVTVCKLIVCL